MKLLVASTWPAFIIVMPPVIVCASLLREKLDKAIKEMSNRKAESVDNIIIIILDIYIAQIDENVTIRNKHMSGRKNNDRERGEKDGQSDSESLSLLIFTQLDN